MDSSHPWTQKTTCGRRLPYGFVGHYKLLHELADPMLQNSRSRLKFSYVIISSLKASSRYFFTRTILAALYLWVLMSSKWCSFKKFHSERSVLSTLQLSNQQNQVVPLEELHLHTSLCPLDSAHGKAFLRPRTDLILLWLLWSQQGYS